VWIACEEEEGSAANRPQSTRGANGGDYVRKVGCWCRGGRVYCEPTRVNAAVARFEGRRWPQHALCYIGQDVNRDVVSRRRTGLQCYPMLPVLPNVPPMFPTLANVPQRQPPESSSTMYHLLFDCYQGLLGNALEATYHVSRGHVAGWRRKSAAASVVPHSPVFRFRFSPHAVVPSTAKIDVIVSSGEEMTAQVSGPMRTTLNPSALV
jgi:hypothetical protein